MNSRHDGGLTVTGTEVARPDKCLTVMLFDVRFDSIAEPKDFFTDFYLVYSDIDSYIRHNSKASSNVYAQYTCSYGYKSIPCLAARCYNGCMSYEVGTHISFTKQRSPTRRQRLYNVGARILFVQVRQVSEPQPVMVYATT